jgi:hypothetical protein
MTVTSPVLPPIPIARVAYQGRLLLQSSLSQTLSGDSHLSKLTRLSIILWLPKCVSRIHMSTLLHLLKTLYPATCVWLRCPKSCAQIPWFLAASTVWNHSTALLWLSFSRWEQYKWYTNLLKIFLMPPIAPSSPVRKGQEKFPCALRKARDRFMFCRLLGRLRKVLRSLFRASHFSLSASYS